MKFLHTSDWHVGKTLKGHSRLDEQRDVLAEIVGIARDHAVDAVLIAGDLYDSSAPGAEAQKILTGALLALADSGTQVLAMAGNHDHPGLLDAYRPLAGHAGITLIGQPRAVDDGGVVTFTARSTGERVNVAVLPFLSQRYAVKAADLLTHTPAEQAGNYETQIRELLDYLTSGFTSDAVNLVMAHLTVTGGVLGGGERSAQTIFDYYVPAAAFGSAPHYVALGHLHRRQTLPANCPVAYSGSPVCVDFGEQDNTPTVVVVEVSPTTPATTTDITIAAGRRMRTVRGTVADLTARAADFGNDWLRVYVTEPARAGLRDDILTELPNALDIRIDPDYAQSVSRQATARPDRSPSELFADYCAERGVDDARVRALFDELHDTLTSPDTCACDLTVPAAPTTTKTGTGA